LTHEEVPLMRVQVLTVADCPNGPVLIERLADALADRPDVEVEHRLVLDAREAARLGMHGSPTLLLDGRDPFTGPQNPAGLSCRLYRGVDGHVEGAASVRELRQVVRDHLASGDPGGRMASVLAVDRGGRGRSAPAERGLRAVQQAVLRAFAATGSPPPAVELQAAAAACGVPEAEVVTELAANDFLCVDEEGRITVAYPFSTAPTEHLVEIGDGPRVWAMCAIDALGIPVMLGRDAVITSTDPASGRPIRVEFVNGTAFWEPSSAVVSYAARAQAGPAAATCCGYLLFFTDRDAAAAWIQQDPDVSGRVLDQTHAEQFGADIFGALLSSS
jgi:hypothetical protein